MALKAHFRWATSATVEVRFYETGGYEGRDPYIGSCNIHILRGYVEISMMHGGFGYAREAYELLRSWLSRHGIRRVYAERNGEIREITVGRR